MRMPRNYLRELALVATVAVLCFAGTRFIAGRLRPPQPRALTKAVGEQVRIPGVNFATARRNVVLVLSSRCHFCIADSGFHRRLVAEALSSGWAVYAVFSPGDADGSYPARLGLSPSMVRRIPFDVLGITVTPAVLLGTELVRSSARGLELHPRKSKPHYLPLSDTRRLSSRNGRQPTWTRRIPRPRRSLSTCAAVKNFAPATTLTQ